MKVGELYYIRKSDPVVSVILYIKNKLYINIGSIKSDRSPLQKRFEDAFYVDSTTSESKLKELKDEDKKIIKDEYIDYAKRMAFEVIFLYEFL
ncbi:MAG: hypothetical protein ACOCRO_01805 [Halanaerobiales bacterium]